MPGLSRGEPDAKRIVVPTLVYISVADHGCLMIVHHLGDIWEIIGIYGNLWRFMVIYRMFHDVFKKSSEHD